MQSGTIGVASRELAESSVSASGSCAAAFILLAGIGHLTFNSRLVTSDADRAACRCWARSHPLGCGEAYRSLSQLALVALLAEAAIRAL